MTTTLTEIKHLPTLALLVCWYVNLNLLAHSGRKSTDYNFTVWPQNGKKSPFLIFRWVASYSLNLQSTMNSSKLVLIKVPSSWLNCKWVIALKLSWLNWATMWLLWLNVIFLLYLRNTALNLIFRTTMKQDINVSFGSKRLGAFTWNKRLSKQLTKLHEHINK